MIYTVLADLVVMLHAAYVAFVVLGLPTILVGIWRDWSWVRNFWFRAVHLIMICLVVFEALLGITCPLTTWEHQLRLTAGETVQAGSFMGRLVHNLLFCEAPNWVFTVCYCLFAAAVLGTLLWCPPRWPGRSDALD